MASRKINPNAKKYASLRKEQAQVNRWLKEAKKGLPNGPQHRAYQGAMNRLHLFQKKHHQTVQGTLSLTGLKTSDIDMYKELLESMKESTFINPTKYAEHQANQRKFFKDEGWGRTDEEVDAYMNFRNSDLVSELEDYAIVPSALLDKASEFIEAEMSLDDFKSMILFWENKIKTEKEGQLPNNAKDDFMNFADDFIDLRNERAGDFNKALNEYRDDNNPMDFESFKYFLNNY